MGNFAATKFRFRSAKGELALALYGLRSVVKLLVCRITGKVRPGKINLGGKAVNQDLSAILSRKNRFYDCRNSIAHRWLPTLFLHGLENLCIVGCPSGFENMYTRPLTIRTDGPVKNRYLLMLEHP